MYTARRVLEIVLMNCGFSTAVCIGKQTDAHRKP